MGQPHATTSGLMDPSDVWLYCVSFEILHFVRQTASTKIHAPTSDEFAHGLDIPNLPVLCNANSDASSVTNP